MWGERLLGLLLVLLGCGAMALIVLAQRAGWFQPVHVPLPAGARSAPLPILTPLSCLLPLASLGALALCLLGLYKLLAPDDWQPPKHLD